MMEMKECLIEEVTFTSATSKVVSFKRDMILQMIKEVILRKLHREAQEMVVMMHFCYLTRLGIGVNHYTTIEKTEDDDVDAFFNIYDSIELQIGPKVYVTFAPSLTKCQPTNYSPSSSFHFEQLEEVQPSYHNPSQLLSH